MSDMMAGKTVTAALVLIALVASSHAVSAQPIQPDTSRDHTLHTTIQQFVAGKLSSEQLGAGLREYGRQFEAKPYKVGASPIEWQMVSQDRLFEFMKVLGTLTEPSLVAWSKGELTAAQAALKIAPFFLIWVGYGLEPTGGGPLFSQKQADELMERIGDFAAP